MIMKVQAPILAPSICDSVIKFRIIPLQNRAKKGSYYMLWKIIQLIC